MSSLYQKLKDAGKKMESHESDLYTPLADDTLEMVRASGLRWTTFTDNDTQELWIEIPFAFDPHWLVRGT